MIRLFVSDIDGCLAMPYTPFRLDRLQALVQRSGTPGAPGLSICSGRAYPYVEAMAQLLNLNRPVLFEAGAGMFDPVSAEIRWHPLFSDDIRTRIDDIRIYMESVISSTRMSIDFAKRSQAALVGTNAAELEAALESISRFVDRNHPGFNTFSTHISIDVVPDILTKVAGLHWLGDVLDMPVGDMAFIGDTNGDIGALQEAGRSFAPKNATESVRKIVQTVCDGRDIDAVIEAFDTVVTENGTS